MRGRRETALALLCVAVGGACGGAQVPRPAGGAADEHGTRGLALSADEPADVASIYARSFAVVVGVDRYESLPRLTGAVRDARGVAAALEARGFETTLLVNGDATRARLAEVLGDELPRRLGADDRVVVYFAGHGVSVGQGNLPRMGYLMPVGGERDHPVSSGVAMSELTTWFNGYPAKHVLFAADACYSGLALASRSAGISPQSSTYLADITSRDVRFALVAGTDDQEAHEWQGQGVFTRFLLEGMDGQADLNGDGFVTSDELATYVKPRVAKLVGAQLRRTQTPQSARLGQGEMVFAVPDRGGDGAASEATPAAAAAPPDRELSPEDERRAELGIPDDVPLGGSADPAAVQAVIGQSIPTIRRCYEAARDVQQQLEGSVGTAFVIGADGRVVWSRVLENTSGSKMLGGCVLDVLGTLSFDVDPEATGVLVRYPFDFQLHASGASSTPPGPKAAPPAP